MRKFKNKKGFTIVELVVVIAVIGVLTAVLVPTFITLSKNAQKANMQSFVTNINKALAMKDSTEGKKPTMHDAQETAKEIGFDIEKITPFDGNDILWDRESNRFVLVNDQEGVVLKDSATDANVLQHKVNLFKVAKPGQTLSTEYSNYLAKGNWETTALQGLTTGIDVGDNQGISQISYVRTSGNSQDVVIRTNGGKLAIGSEEHHDISTIHHYGTVSEAVVYTGNDSFHAHGAVGKLELKSGKAVAEKNGIVYLVEANADGIEVKENGGRFVIPKGVSTTAVSTAIAATIGYSTTESNYDNATITGDKTYEIGSLSSLESFRDLVNGGFNFKGITVKLTSDITLNDGWKPIGEGSRDVNVNNYVGSYLPEHDGKGASFSGIFDGNNKTISNLNNKGYVPSLFSIDGESVKLNNVKTLINTYEVFNYGFFGILSNATVKNVTFNNVDIDFSQDISVPNATTDQKIAKADSIGALAGYSAGDLNVSGITVNGKIKGLDAIGGVVGRAYNVSATNPSLVIDKCTNNAKIEANGDKAAGIIGFANKKQSTNDFTLSISNNINNGDIYSSKYASGILNTQAFTSASFTKNTNNGDVHTSGYADNFIGVSYVGMIINTTHGAVAATGNTNSKKAYIGDDEVATNIVCARHSSTAKDTELNTNTVAQA